MVTTYRYCTGLDSIRSAKCVEDFCVGMRPRQKNFPDVVHPAQNSPLWLWQMEY